MGRVAMEIKEQVCDGCHLIPSVVEDSRARTEAKNTKGKAVSPKSKLVPNTLAFL